MPAALRLAAVIVVPLLLLQLGPLLGGQRGHPQVLDLPAQVLDLGPMLGGIAAGQRIKQLQAQIGEPLRVLG